MEGEERSEIEEEREEPEEKPHLDESDPDEPWGKTGGGRDPDC